MRKIFMKMMLLAMTIVIPSAVKADTELSGTPKVWTVPAVFAADEEVTFYYDVTDVGFEPGVDLYLWAWQPTEPDAGNGGNSSDFAKLDYLGDNIYKKTMVPTEYFHTGVEAFEDANWPGFWQKLKTKNGEYWCGAFAAPDNRTEWEAFKKSGNEYQIFSGKKSTGYSDKFALNEPMTIVFNPDLFKVNGITMSEFAKKPGFGGFKLHSGLNDWTFQEGVKVWIDAAMKKVDIHKLANGYYSISMESPYQYYGNVYDDSGNLKSTGLETDTEIENLAWLVVGIVNNDWGGTSPDMSAKAGTATPYPDPIFTVFPTRFSSKDIITLTREYNERTAGELGYKITAGSKIITGTMSGVRDKRQATVNLNKELKGTSVEQIAVEVTKENGQTVVETTIPIVTPDAQ